jgi:mono/diheme cytochrome c family protein
VSLVLGNQSRLAGDKLRVSELSRFGVAACMTAVLALTAVSCGGSTGSSDAGADGAAAQSSPVERGKRIAGSSGCSGCHGSNFDGGAGPTWVGLAGSEVELTDGSFIVADDAYLYRAIADPAADQRDGFSLRMPSNRLSDEEITDVVEFIKSLEVNDD